MSAISRQTHADLVVVAAFFGCELEHNRHIFRFAADNDGAAFATTMGHLATAIRQDRRHGILERIRAALAAEKESMKSEGSMS